MFSIKTAMQINMNCEQRSALHYWHIFWQHCCSNLRQSMLLWCSKRQVLNRTTCPRTDLSAPSRLDLSAYISTVRCTELPVSQWTYCFPELTKFDCCFDSVPNMGISSLF